MPSTTEIYQKFLDQFPFKQPREEQLQAFNHLAPWVERLFIQEFQNPMFFGVDAPTGIGKSPLALSIAKAVKELYNEEFGDSIDEDSDSDTAQVWVVTQNKILQDQYQKDFGSELFDLRGLDNYDCNFDAGKTCGQSICGRIRKKEGQKGSPPNFCSFACDYDEASKEAKKAPILSLNVAKALTMLKNPRISPPIMMIFDEGHEVENALDNEATFSITPDELQRIGLPFPKYFSDLNDLQQIKDGMMTLVKDCAPLRDAEADASPASRDVRRYKKLESIITKVGDTLSSIENGIEYVSCSDEKLELKPLQVYKVFEKFFKFPTLFMSATLLSKTGFQSITGLEPKALDWFSCPSPFPVANRPIRFFWRFGSPPLNYQNLQQEMKNLVARTSVILDKHANEKGIVHTHTYKIAERLYQDLYPKYGHRLLFPKTAKEQKDILEQHARSKNSVLISPSMTQGVDLKDDLCRFSVMAKVPWPPMQDPVVKARMEMDPSWYSYKTAQTIVQAPGRGVRSATDYAETYLLDPAFQRFFNQAKGHLPKWFLDSIIPKAQAPY